MADPKEQNNRVHCFVIPLMHAFLWFVALLISCYSGWMSSIDDSYKTICVFLIIYGTFMFEGGLIWWDAMATNFNKAVQINDFGFIKSLFFNMSLTLVLVVLFFTFKISWLIIIIGLTAAWLKFIVSRINPMIENSAITYVAAEYEYREI